MERSLPLLLAQWTRSLLGRRFRLPIMQMTFETQSLRQIGHHSCFSQKLLARPCTLYKDIAIFISSQKLGITTIALAFFSKALRGV